MLEVPRSVVLQQELPGAALESSGEGAQAVLHQMGIAKHLCALCIALVHSELKRVHPLALPYVYQRPKTHLPPRLFVSENPVGCSRSFFVRAALFFCPSKIRSFSKKT